MNGQNDREKIHQALDSALSGLQADPYLFRRVQAKLEGEEKPMKRSKMPLSIALAAIAILSMFTVAVATGVRGYVNWKGEFVPDEVFELPAPTEAPEGMANEQKLFDLTQELLNSAGEKECVEVWSENGGSGNYPKIETDSLQRMQELLDDAVYMPVANFVPEGYEFTGGQVIYGCDADGRYERISHEELPEGLSVDRYRIAEGHDFVEAYEMIFRDSEEDFHYLEINVRLTESGDANDHTFGVNEDQSAQSLNVPGMEYALAITGSNWCSVDMLKKLDEPIDFISFTGRGMDYASTYQNVEISISGPQLSIDTLTSMFATK